MTLLYVGNDFAAFQDGEGNNPDIVPFSEIARVRLAKEN